MLRRVSFGDVPRMRASRWARLRNLKGYRYIVPNENVGTRPASRFQRDFDIYASVNGGDSQAANNSNVYNNDSRTDQASIVHMLERNKAVTKAEIQREMIRSCTAYAKA